MLERIGAERRGVDDMGVDAGVDEGQFSEAVGVVMVPTTPLGRQKSWVSTMIV
jgi:hypothetical protein